MIYVTENDMYNMMVLLLRLDLCPEALIDARPLDFQLGGRHG